MSENIKDLIARLEAATGPDRELDIAICIATANICDSVNPAGVSNLKPDPDDPEWVLYDYEGVECTDSPRSFTSSIDAALTLVEGFAADICRYSTGRGWASLWGDQSGRKFRAEATNSAIALCIAALKAKDPTP